jgi:hypothetical protein
LPLADQIRRFAVTLGSTVNPLDQWLSEKLLDLAATADFLGATTPEDYDTEIARRNAEIAEDRHELAVRRLNTTHSTEDF